MSTAPHKLLVQGSFRVSCVDSRPARGTGGVRTDLLESKGLAILSQKIDRAGLLCMLIGVAVQEIPFDYAEVLWRAPLPPTKDDCNQMSDRLS